MPENGEYYGTCDDILARHESRYDMRGIVIHEDVVPMNYLDWSEKKWQGEWHRHRKFLKERASKKEIESTKDAYIIANLRAEITTRLVHALNAVEIKKGKVEYDRRIQKGENAMNIAKRSENLQGILNAYKMYPELFGNAKRIDLIHFREALILLEKKSHKRVRNIVIELKGVIEAYLTQSESRG